MSESIVIRNGTVLTMNDADDVHFGGTVVIEGDRITARRAAGEAVDAPPAADGDRRDRQGRAAGPGRPPLPHRARQGLERPPARCGSTCRPCWYPMIRALDPEAAYWAALASYSGVDPVRRHDGQRHVPPARRRSADAADEIGIRAVLSQRRRRRRARPRHARRQRAAFRESKDGAADGRIEVRVGIEWLPLASDGPAARSAGARRRAGHRDPHPPQRVADRGRDSQGEVRAPADRGRLRHRDPGPGLHRRALRVALRHRDRADARDRHPDLATTRAPTPSWATAIARLPEMLAAGLNVGLGHDAAECNNSRDLFEVMKFASLMHRASRVDAGAAAGAGRRADGDPQRRARARPRDR